MKALEKQLQQKKDSDPIMAGILEEVRHIMHWRTGGLWKENASFVACML